MARVNALIAGKGVWSPYAKRMRNFACLRYAVEFYNVARKTGCPIIRAFLIGQAIELYLKAFLFHQGYGEKKLKNKPFGHNLTRLLEEAIANGLNTRIYISPALRSDLDSLNKVYSSKALQYFSIVFLIATPTLPKLARLLRFVSGLDHYLVCLIPEPE